MLRSLKICLIALLAMPWTGAGATAAQSSEYAVKAAFIHNIAKFVEWPKLSGDGKLRLCVLGENPFGDEIAVLHGKRVGRMVWEVLAVDLESVRSCQVLFIAESMQRRIGAIRQRIDGETVLTIGDTPGYAEQGVMVNFYVEDNRVRFEINRDAASHAGLRIGSQLLRLGRIVSEPGGDR